MGVTCSYLSPGVHNVLDVWIDAKRKRAMVVYSHGYTTYLLSWKIPLGEREARGNWSRLMTGWIGTPVSTSQRGVAYIEIAYRGEK